MFIGYARVSIADSNQWCFRKMPCKTGCNKVFKDIMCGSTRIVGDVDVCPLPVTCCSFGGWVV